MQYIRNKKLGYDKDHLMTIPNSYTLGKNEKVFKEEIIRLPGVLQATTSYYKPAGPSGNNNSLIYPLGNDNQIMKALEYNVDENYIPCLSLSMASGRNFSKDMQTDSTGMIINETAARAFGWNVQSAIGKTIVQQNSNRGANIPYHIIGVVRDFHFRSLHETISPLLMDLYPESGLILKIKTAELPALIASMQKTWEAFNTGEPFSYEFMNDLYNKTYATEQKTGTILDIFSSLTILVASLGLFGLITFTVEQRTREIGIRKVLGARVSELTRLVSKDLLLLVLISCILAFPVAWWGMNKWLESFAYRTSLHWWVFPLAGLMALILALVTISIQAIRAAIANPVKSLRTE
jgi:putative ABC transport system permease protein